ncbi:MAG: hypothetical protein DRJ63_06030 [Thermoprotei archaeon]|nr:MAG: hypothetical protein DRJ63_06030 [Thermoprotei archaeon]
MIKLYRKLGRIALKEFSDIVVDVEYREDRLRIHIVDGSFLDVWFSLTIKGKYAYHWERRFINGTVYRWDNARHEKWRSIGTYPHHFHEGTREKVKPFYAAKSPEDNFRKVLKYIRNYLSSRK